MHKLLSRALPALAIFFLISCKGRNQDTGDSAGIPGKGSLTTAQQADSSLAPAKAYFDKELREWAGSFTGFSTDSFRMTEERAMDWTEIEDKPENMKQYFELYKASLVYSPDSSYFVDLYSSNISLEKKGKKITAIGDADQAVLLCNEKTKEWKRLIAFGPSAVIEEVVWTAPSAFIMAGAFSNDEGKWTPIILLCDTDKKSMRWFESAITRPESSSYGPSGMAKLKIDEWE